MHRPLPLTLGLNLRAIRKGLGLSQEKMAEQLDVHRTYLGGLERGERNPTLQTVENLSTRLGVTPIDLIWDEAHVIVEIDDNGTKRLKGMTHRRRRD